MVQNPWFWERLILRLDWIGVGGISMGYICPSSMVAFVLNFWLFSSKYCWRFQQARWLLDAMVYCTLTLKVPFVLLRSNVCKPTMLKLTISQNPTWIANRKLRRIELYCYIVHGIFSISEKTHTELPRIYDLGLIVSFNIVGLQTFDLKRTNGTFKVCNKLRLFLREGILPQ
jgi:hypothetical protein